MAKCRFFIAKNIIGSNNFLVTTTVIIQAQEFYHCMDLGINYPELHEDLSFCDCLKQEARREEIGKIPHLLGKGIIAYST